MTLSDAGPPKAVEVQLRDSPQKLERELARCRAALTDSQDRHRDTALLLERLSCQNAELRSDLERAQERVAELEHPFDDCGAKPCKLRPANDQEQECVALRLKARETIQALESRVQAANSEEERWHRRCQELESQVRQSAATPPEAHLATVELGNLRHRVWQLEQNLQAEKRLAAELRAELDRRQTLLGTARHEVDEGRGHVAELRREASEMKEMHAVASAECRQYHHQRQLIEQRVAEAMEEQQDALSEEHAQDTERLHLEMKELLQELEAARSNAKAEPYETIPPTLPLHPPRSTSSWLLGSAAGSSRARPPELPGAVPPSWSAGDSAGQRRCRQCQYFYFSGDGESETGRKCRQCQYYYFSPDGPTSPDVHAGGSVRSYFASSSPSRSPKRVRMPGTAMAAADDRAVSTRLRLEMSALELAVQKEEDAAFRSEQAAHRNSEAAAEVKAATQDELQNCRALMQEEMCMAAAWRAEAEALTARLAQAGTPAMQESLGTLSLASNTSPGTPEAQGQAWEEQEHRKKAWEELDRSRAEVERLEQQSQVWERRRNLWEERCMSREGELEQARQELSLVDAHHSTVQHHLTELEALDDVCSRPSVLASIQEDAGNVQSEHQACLATESDRCIKAERELEDLRARHETWRTLLQAAACGSLALHASPRTLALDMYASPRRLDPGRRPGEGEEVANAIEGHIRTLAGLLSSPLLGHVA